MPTQPASGQTRPKSTPTLFWVVVTLAAGLLALYLVKAGVLRTGRGAAVQPARGRATAPEGVLKSVSNPSRSLSLASLKGKVVVLHFWATWCPPCRAEFPEFARFAAAARPEDPWVVVPVSIDDSPDPVGPYLAKLPERFPVYWDEGGTLANALNVSAIPTTVILDRDGRVAQQDLGVANWSSNGVPATVRALSHE